MITLLMGMMGNRQFPASPFVLILKRLPTTLGVGWGVKKEKKKNNRLADFSDASMLKGPYQRGELVCWTLKDSMEEKHIYV